METTPYDYFCRTTSQLSKQTELEHVLTTCDFSKPLPILYVLYGTESKLIKVGKTKVSNQRLRSYLHASGKTSSGSNFRKDDTIHLIGYYLLPNFDYNDKMYADFMSDCEHIMIDNAKTEFGQPVYSNEWFSSNDMIYDILTKIPNLFKNMTQVIDASMYKIVDSPIIINDKLKQGIVDINDYASVVKRFAQMAYDNGYLDNYEIPSSVLFNLFKKFEEYENLHTKITQVWFSREIKKYMLKHGFTQDTNELVSVNSLTPLEFDEQLYINYINPKSNDDIYNGVNRQRVFKNVKNKIKPFEIKQVRKKLASGNYDYDETDIKARRILRYLAKMEQNNTAQSLLVNTVDESDNDVKRHVDLFKRMIVKGGYDNNHIIPTNALINLYKEFETKNHLKNGLGGPWLGRTLKKAMEELGFEYNVKQTKYAYTLSPLDFDIDPYNQYLGTKSYEETLSFTNRQRYYIKDENKIEQSDVDTIRNELASGNYDYDETDIKARRILRYLAKMEQNSTAQSLLGA